MVGRLRVGGFGVPIGFSTLKPDVSGEDAAGVSLALLPAIVANPNWGPRTDFSELMILSRSASGIAPPTLAAFPSNSACNPGILKLSSAALKPLAQCAGPAFKSTERSPVIFWAPNTVLSESVMELRVASSPTVPE